MNKLGEGISTGWIVLAVIIGLGLIATFTVIGMYNGLVASDVQTEKMWGNVESALQRRYDLIPNIVATVQGAANFEKSTYIAVTEARTKWLDAGTVAEKQAAANELEGTLSRLLVTVENYPQLKANENFLSLQDELAGTENRIKYERDNYNEAVRTYKYKCKAFPTVIFANMFGYNSEKWSMFEAKEGAEDAVKVSFE